MRKPPQLNATNAGRFQQASIVDRYHLRPPYPAETFNILTGLVQDEPRRVLDVGTGTGDIARELVLHNLEVDAVDMSAPMMERGKTLPNGNHPGLTWHLGPIETIPLTGPYAMIVGGSSLHWVDWEVAFLRFAGLLTPNGVVVLLTRQTPDLPWGDARMALIKAYSLAPDYEPFSLPGELSKRGVFTQLGEHETTPVPFRQSIDDYIDSEHSCSTLSLEDMPAENVRAFDAGLREIVTAYADADGMLTMMVSALITWGKPG